MFFWHIQPLKAFKEALFNIAWQTYTLFENYSKCRISIFRFLAFSTSFCPFKSDMSGNTVLPKASGCQNSLAMLNATFGTIFKHCDILRYLSRKLDFKEDEFRILNKTFFFPILNFTHCCKSLFFCLKIRLRNCF